MKQLVMPKQLTRPVKFRSFKVVAKENDNAIMGLDEEGQLWFGSFNHNSRLEWLKMDMPQVAPTISNQPEQEDVGIE